ncbi:MAG: hypothetical protein GVY18_08320 [Bacteroidetes bacterium]|jgi:hypothetical protein|nr:hypothetical protein [Bacteroidota bacterium]
MPKIIWMSLLLFVGGGIYVPATLSPPDLLYPEENGFNWTGADFAWTSSPGAVAYQFQIVSDNILRSRSCCSSTTDSVLDSPETPKSDAPTWNGSRKRCACTQRI